MSYQDDEESVEKSEPREGIEIKHGDTTYRVASGSRDETFNGNVFPASPAERGEASVSRLGDNDDVTVQLPVSHPFVQRWLSSLSPPRNPLLTIWRKQIRSGEVERYWDGRLTTCNVEGHLATLTGRTVVSIAVQRRLSTITIGRQCPHILYDQQCRVNRAGFRVDTTVALVDGNAVTVVGMGGKPSHWAKRGEILHVPSGERMTIAEQVGTLLTLQLAIPDLSDGDAVQVFAGCDHSITDCSTKFANQANYGGAPRSPKENPFIPGKKLGIIVQE